MIRSMSVDTPWLILLDCPDKGQDLSRPTNGRVTSDERRGFCMCFVTQAYDVKTKI